MIPLIWYLERMKYMAFCSPIYICLLNCCITHFVLFKIYYGCYYSKLSSCKLSPLRRVCISCLFIQLHPFSFQLSDPILNSYAHSYMYSCKIWNLLPLYQNFLTLKSAFSNLISFYVGLRLFLNRWKKY